MHIIQTNFAGNPNIGLYAFCTDKFCIAGLEVPKKRIDELKEILQVPVHQVTIAGTSMTGVFLAGHADMVLVPSIAFDHELEALDKLGIPYKVFDSTITALGNNILCTSKGGLVSTDFTEEERAKLQETLGIQLKAGKIAELPNVGSLGIATQKGCLLHPEAEDFEIEYVETLLNVKCMRGSINGGNPYVKAGCIANSNGFVAGKQSTGIELNTADRAFRFIGD